MMNKVLFLCTRGSGCRVRSYEFDASPSTYVPVALQFERSGIVEANVLIVPPTGYYEGIEPVPPAM